MTVHPTSIPLGWIRPSSAYFIACASKEENAANSKFKALLTALDNLAIRIDHQAECDSAPWLDEKVLGLISASDRPQLVVIAPHLSVCAAGVASMGMEKGYDVFVVCSDLSAAAYADFIRFSSMGIKLVGGNRFIEECTFALE